MHLLELEWSRSSEEKTPLRFDFLGVASIFFSIELTFLSLFLLLFFEAFVFSVFFFFFSQLRHRREVKLLNHRIPLFFWSRIRISLNKKKINFFNIF